MSIMDRVQNAHKEISRGKGINAAEAHDLYQAILHSDEYFEGTEYETKTLMAAAHKLATFFTTVEEPEDTDSVPSINTDLESARSTIVSFSGKDEFSLSPNERKELKAAEATYNKIVQGYLAEEQSSQDDNE